MPLQTKTGARLASYKLLTKKMAFFHPPMKDAWQLAAQASIALKMQNFLEEVVEIKNYNESILQSMSNGMITLNAENRLVTANHAGLSFWTQYGTDEMGWF